MPEKKSVYDMRSAKLPRAAGFQLKLLAWLVENPITRPLVMPTLLSGAGIDRMRALHFTTEPTYVPFHPFEPPAGKVAPVKVDKVPKIQPHKKSAPFTFRTARQYAEAYRDGDFTPVEIAERALKAIAASDASSKPFRAFTHIHEEEVLKEAQAATRRIKARKPLSILDGVMFAVKDEMDVEGYPTTVGTRLLNRNPAKEDATAVARLRALGMVMLGKTNMHEMGISTTGLNIHYGTPRNPYNLDHHTGGSSSGPAAAVAAGIVPLALGADGGGSIRIPPSFCGVVGLMSTTGRVSNAGGYPIDRTTGHLGPAGATAEDVALAYAAIAGSDPRDVDSFHQPPVSVADIANTDLAGVTLGWYPEWFHHAEPEVVATCDAMLKALRKAGAKVKEIEIPGLDAAYVAHATSIVSEMLASLNEYWDTERHLLSPEVRIPLTMIENVSPADFIQAQRIRTVTLRTMYEVFEKVDAIITPTVPMTAPLIQPDALKDGETNLTLVIETLRYVTIANLCGLPAISFPAGYSSKGMPIGLQALGKPWSEELLLRLAYTADGLMERRKPKLYYDLFE